MIDIDFKFPDWAATVKAHEGELNLLTAATVQANRGMLFDSEGSYNGRPGWAKLQFRNGQILSKKGVLRKSIAPYNPNGTPGPDGIVRFAGESVTIGTKLFFARLMNDGTANMPGGVLRPVKAKALKIPIPQGKAAGPAAEDMQALHHQTKVSKLVRAYDKNEAQRGRKYKPHKSQEILVRIDRLTQKMASGKGPVKFIFRKWVRIPGRPFDDWNDNDQRELDATILSKVKSLMNGDR